MVDIWLMSQIPIGWLKEGFETTPKTQQLTDDSWYTKPAPLFSQQDNPWLLGPGVSAEFSINAGWSVTKSDAGRKWGGIKA